MAAHLRRTPLHFMCQVDCAEVAFPTELPERGALFFFGRDDDEQLWNYDPPASDDCRVLFAPDGFCGAPRRDAPADLPPIGAHPRNPLRAWREYLLEGEIGPNLYVEWPIRPLSMPTWPDASALPEMQLARQQDWRSVLSGFLPRRDVDRESFVTAYEDRLREKRLEAFVAATGRPLDRDPDSLRRDREAGIAIFSDPSWPRHWIYIHYVARKAVRRPSWLFNGANSKEAIAEAAEQWLRRSEGHSLDEEVPDEVRADFRSWAATFRHPQSTRPVDSGTANIAFASAEAAIRSWAGEPSCAALIPPRIYEAMTGEFGGWSVWGLQFSQMLGHAPSAQEGLTPDDPTICLLSLASDAGLGWMFCDVGEASFWIPPRDLARHDFSRVWATIEGH